MIKVKTFTFNAFQENTYVLYDETSKECFVIDPGCSNKTEDQELISFIEANGLVPSKLLNTHCHIDHVLGNQVIADQYNLSLESHRLEIPVLASCEQVSKMYGIPYRGSPDISQFHEEGDVFHLGDSKIKVLLTPGHSPGSICFYLEEEDVVIGGDVLFQGSIGRTDLPGGNYETLIRSIKTKLLPLPERTTVYPGHGPSTTIGKEKIANPFLA